MAALWRAVLSAALGAVVSGSPSDVTAVEHVAAAPQIIICYGTGLRSPVVLKNWQENSALLRSLVPRPPSAPRSREATDSLRLALFWGVQWRDVASDSVASARLDPRQANQVGWLFFSRTGRVLEVTLSNLTSGIEVPTGARLYGATEQTRMILLRHHIPDSAPSRLAPRVPRQD